MMREKGAIGQDQDAVEIITDGENRLDLMVLSL